MRFANVASRFGRRVAKLRRRRGLTQEQVSERTGLEYKYLQRLESPGRRPVNPTLKTLLRLAAVLGVAPKSLLDGLEPGAGRFRRASLKRKP